MRAGQRVPGSPAAGAPRDPENRHWKCTSQLSSRQDPWTKDATFQTTRGLHALYGGGGDPLQHHLPGNCFLWPKKLTLSLKATGIPECLEPGASQNVGWGRPHPGTVCSRVTAARRSPGAQTAAVDTGWPSAGWLRPREMRHFLPMGAVASGSFTPAGTHMCSEPQLCISSPADGFSDVRQISCAPDLTVVSWLRPTSS